MGSQGMDIANKWAIVKYEPIYWVSLVTGKEYEYDLYHNHGKGGVYRNKIDLPAEDYPYKVRYDITIPKFL